EWNIDATNEYHIINKLQEMIMVSNPYKIKNTFDKILGNLLIVGFTGQLKGWWDNVITIQQQTEILDSIQINEIEKSIMNSYNKTVEDVDATLIYNITIYFIGDLTYVKDKTTEQLSNLKLQDFRWYKNTFMTKVLTREDANQPYWKEKIDTGLTTLFAEKINCKYHE
ncbi:hypothetical protein CFOL_v3_23660, partial [Cephalotus follicularis]